MLSKRRIHFDKNGLPSQADMNHVLDDVDRLLRSLDRRVSGAGAASVANARDLASVTRIVGGGGAAGQVTPRRLAYVACVANQATYALGFSPNPSQVVLAWNRGMMMTPNVDYTISGSNITLVPGQVPTVAEGYILVEGAPL